MAVVTVAILISFAQGCTNEELPGAANANRTLAEIRQGVAQEIRMPAMDGLTATREIKASRPQTQVFAVVLKDNLLMLRDIILSDRSDPQQTPL